MQASTALAEGKPATYYAIYRCPPDCPRDFAVIGWEPRIGGAPALGQTEYEPTLESARLRIPPGYERHNPTDNDRREVPNLVEVWKAREP